MSDDEQKPPPSEQILSADPVVKRDYEEEYKEALRLAAEHYSAIGRVAANWALFEATIDDQSIELSGIPYEIGICFASQIMGSRSKLENFIALVKHLGIPEHFTGKLENFARTVTNLSEKRNRVVHDPWILSKPAKPQRYETTARRKLRIKLIEVPTEDIIKLAHNIEGVIFGFLDLVDSIRKSLPPQTGPEPPSDEPSQESNSS
ncbi:MAG TPA: hypothetical protein VMF05_07605 [Stellaceae bacterium]|nr:hypothetical protein [Stellaceae bacterium]